MWFLSAPGNYQDAPTVFGGVEKDFTNFIKYEKWLAFFLKAMKEENLHVLGLSEVFETGPILHYPLK